jgi:outer membrane lipoprotein-sorting protein
MNKTLLILTLLLSVRFSSAQLKPMDMGAVSRLRAAMKEAALRTSSLTADFSQEKEMTMMEENIISDGKFFFKKEKLLRWEYIHPYRYVIIINNDKITLQDGERTSTFNTQTGKEFREINNLIIGSINGTLLNDDKNFAPSFFDSPDASVVKLKPLAPGLKATLSEIAIWIDKTTLTVNKLEMTEVNGDKTRIAFSGKQINKPVPDEKFRTQ